MVAYRRQLVVFALLLAANALLAFLTYALGLTDQFFAGQEMPPEIANTPPWLVGLANAGIIRSGESWTKFSRSSHVTSPKRMRSGRVASPTPPAFAGIGPGLMVGVRVGVGPIGEFGVIEAMGAIRSPL